MTALYTAEAMMAHTVQSTINDIVSAGAREFVWQPWRVRRLIANADMMGVAELRQAVKDRGRLRRPVDMNTALALAQLARALDNPGFESAWAAERQQARMS
jgi:hypothetical protein